MGRCFFGGIWGPVFLGPAPSGWVQGARRGRAVGRTVGHAPARSGARLGTQGACTRHAGAPGVRRLPSLPSAPVGSRRAQRPAKARFLSSQGGALPGTQWGAPSAGGRAESTRRARTLGHEGRS